MHPMVIAFQLFQTQMLCYQPIQNYFCRLENTDRSNGVCKFSKNQKFLGYQQLPDRNFLPIQDIRALLHASLAFQMKLCSTFPHDQQNHQDKLLK